MHFGSNLLPFLLLPLLSFSLAGTSVPEEVPTEYSPAWLGVLDETWRSLDNPGASTLPEPMRRLVGRKEAIFESITESRLFFVRTFADCEMPIDAFVGDEEVMNSEGEFIPLADRALEGANGEMISFDCEWVRDSVTARISALYTFTASGEVRSLWLMAADDTPFEELQAELQAIVERFEEGPGQSLPESYTAILNGHQLSFNVSVADEIQLQPVESIDADHALFVTDVMEANPQFQSSHTRQWRDEERDVMLSYQVVSHDLSIGPDRAFVQWLSTNFQIFLREDERKWDIPVELIHLEEARTEVVDDETLEQHIQNNLRGPQVGVVLEIVIPRSPYARVCRLSWSRLQADEKELFGRQWVIGLRHYHLVRGETVTGVSAVMLRAEARSEADLDVLEASLAFTSRPLEGGGRFPLLD
jgi:hypothetical protein